MSDPGAASVHVDSVMGSTRSFNPGPKVGKKKKKKRRPQFVFVKAWDEEKHPRGQPDNKGEFAKVPDDPGTTPIPEGHMRLWHYTGTDNIESIKQNGLRVQNAKGDTYGEPNQVWASAGMPDDDMFHNKNMVEFHIDPRQLDIGSPLGGEKATDEEAARQAKFLTERDSNVTVRGDVPPENIIAVHEPWQASLRYLRGNADYYKENPDFLDEESFKDDPDTLKAIRQFKAELQQPQEQTEPSLDLKSKDELPGLLQQLANRPKDAPPVNLMQATVGGKPLFPHSDLGIPRADMPQLGGKAAPGSPASKLPINARGNVDLSTGFADYLKDKGVGVKDETVPASTLQAAQDELNGRTVAILATQVRHQPGYSARPTWVSKDGYIIDGTHRWAGALADNDAEMPIRRADTDIRSALRMAQQYADEMGVKSESVSDTSPADAKLEDTALHNAEATGGFSLHPSTGAPPSRGFMVAIAGHNVEVPDVTDLSEPNQRAAVGRAIRQFVVDNAELWKSNPQAYVGGWWDKAHGEFVLDGSENVLDQAQATKLGQQRNQQSIWDVVKGEEIDTGGTGDRAAAGADDTGDGQAVAAEAGGPPAPNLLKATGGWLAGRTRRVGGGLPGPAGGQASAGAGDREAVAADTGRTDHRGRGFFRFLKHDVSDEQRDDHGRWTTGGSDAEGVRGSGSGSPLKREPGPTAKLKADLRKDTKPTKTMLVAARNKREGVETWGDLQPGDVVRTEPLPPRTDPATYSTVEHVGRFSFAGVQDEDVHVLLRTPSGRMRTTRRPATEKLFPHGGQTSYLGSEPTGHAIGVEFGAGLPPHAEREARQAVDIVQSRLKRKGALDDLRITAAHIEPNRFAEYDSRTKEIRVNDKHVGGYDPGDIGHAHMALGNSYNTTVNSNFHPKRNGYSALTTVLVHEIGHHLHMKPRAPQDMGRKPTLLKMLTRIDDDFTYFEDGPLAEGGLWNTPFSKTIAKTVSSYASDNIREFVAEAYAEGMLADRPRPMARLVTKYLNGEDFTNDDVDKARAQWNKARDAAEKEPEVVRFRVKDGGMTKLIREKRREIKLMGDEDYRGLHTAPGPDLGDPMHDLGRNVLPSDTYDHQDWYGSGDDRSDSESWAAMRRARGNPDAIIRIYRAVPVGHTHIHAGDWVTPSKSYAEHHAIGNMGEEPAHVIHMDVPAKELWTNGDSYNEWGWHPA